MTKNKNAILSMGLSLSLVLGSTLPVGATTVENVVADQVAVVDTQTKETEKAVAIKPSNTVPEITGNQSTENNIDFSLDSLFKGFTVDNGDFSFDVKFDAAAVMATSDVEIDNTDPVIATLEAELNSIVVLNEETGETEALTEEQINTILYLYQQYTDHWTANADVLGVQTPFFLSYNDKEDGLGVLGEMLVLAGVSVDQVRSGEYSYDDLIGMIQNFTYADVLGVQYYKTAIKEKRDEVLALIEASGAKTEAQKLLVLNDWMAHINTFDMPYIMNSGKAEDEKPMVAENPQQHEHYQDVYDVIYADYEKSIEDQFRQQIEDGLRAEFKYKYYNAAIESVVHDMIYEKAKAQAVEDVKAALQKDIRDKAEADKKKEIWDAAYEEALKEYEDENHEHTYEAKFNWVADAEKASATVNVVCTQEGCDKHFDNVEVPEDNIKSVTKESTCKEQGTKTYTASVKVVDEDGTEIDTFSDTEEVKLPLADHAYEETFEWEVNGESVDGATVTVACTTEGCDKKVTQEVPATAIKLSNETKSTCQKQGTKTYTVSVEVKDEDGTVLGTFPGETVVNLPLADHEYEAVFKWDATAESADATVTVTCKNEGCNKEVTQKVPATSIAVGATTESTCKEQGTKEYTASVEVRDEDGTVLGTFTGKTVVDLPLADHNYGSDGVCTGCGEKKEAATDKTVTDDTPATDKPATDESVAALSLEDEVAEEVAVLSLEDEVAEAAVLSLEDTVVEAVVVYSEDVDAETYAKDKADAAVETDEAKAEITAAGDAAVAAVTAEELEKQATAVVEGDAETVAQLEAAADEQTAAYMEENAAAIKEDPVGFVDSQEMFQTEVPVTDADGNYVMGDDGNPVKMTIAAQLHSGWDAFWADAEENGVEVDPENYPGYKMTIEEIVEKQMDTPMDDLPAKEDGTHMTPNEAIPVYAAQAAKELTNGVINYWEGSQFGALGFGTSVCLGYTKAYTYLVQCMHPEVYLKDGATDINNAENWKAAADLYYDAAGNLDITQNYLVDAVRITFDASVTMYGETQDNFNSDHFWNAVKVDGKWYYVDPCYTDVFMEVMMRDRVETDGSMNHLYFLFSHTATVQLYDGNYKEIKTLYENAATDTSYEDSWISRIKSNTYFDGGYAYYLYDSTDMLTMMDNYNSNNSTETEDTVYKLVRHKLTDKDAGETCDEYEELIVFNYKEDEDAEPVARVLNPETGKLEDNEMLTALYAKHAAYEETYPSLALTAAVYDGKVYFNLANCILSCDIETNEIAVVKEYNTVYGVRDNTNPFGGMAFTATTKENADFTFENRPVAGMTIKEDGQMYVAIATNLGFISGKADRTNPASEGYGYVYEESNYNADYNSYMDYSDYGDIMGQYGITEEKNDNDEFMWTANIVETLSMSHLAGDTHSYEEVTVEPTCEENGYTENRCTTCGRIEAETRVEEEGTACEHHYLEFNETYYTKDDNGNWNTGVCYVCIVCGHAVEEPVKPTGNAATDEALEEYEKELAAYEAIKEAAGHTYDAVDPQWAADNSTVTFSSVKCSSICEERQPYLDVLVEDTTIALELADKVVAEASVISKEGVCPEGVTQVYGASGEVTSKDGKKVTYETTKTVEIEPGDHSYEDGVCNVCGDCSVKRIFGESRIETALGVADKLKEVLNVESFDAIIVAYGDNFADALAGSYLANVKSAPILLNRDKNAMVESNLEYIKNNLSENGVVYLLGGTAVLSEEVEKDLEGYNVKRLAGEKRFETNLAILEEAGVKDEEILIVTGWEFADSLSASATGLPIFLADTNNGSLTDDQVAFLKSHKDNKYTIIGGTAAISEALESAIEEVVGKDIQRVFGEKREETSTQIARTYFKDVESVVVAYSFNFPDGLCGGPLAHAMNAPLILTTEGKENAATEYIKESDVKSGYVLGGEVVLKDETIKTVFSLSDFAEIGIVE